MLDPFIVKALVYFPNDPSVGISASSFAIETPIQRDNLNEFREALRKEIKELYEKYSDMVCMVFFDDETF